MSQSQPKKNSRKPELAVGTRVRYLMLDGVIAAVRRPKFARRYVVDFGEPDDNFRPFRRNQLEVIG